MLQRYSFYFATERSGKDEIVCAFTLANDSIKAALIPNASRNKKYLIWDANDIHKRCNKFFIILKTLVIFLEL